MNARAEYERWRAAAALSDDERRELDAISCDDAEIEARFFEPLAFGTAGLRGIMALGTNRMNVHVIRRATQAFAEIINEKNAQLQGETPCVALCFDPRNNSRFFAEEAASVLAANGIHVRIFDDMRPTPELSFAIRRYGCNAGINITASHNTREYNGYKVYWADGAQLPPQEAELVAERMAQLDIFDSVKRIPYSEAAKQGLITIMSAETDEEFLAAALGEATERAAVAAVADNFSVVYTPFHGAGRLMVSEALRRLGITRLHCVAEQMVPDGDFTTVASPNPENPESFAIAEKLAHEVRADIIIGTDPDCDRIAILYRDGEEYRHLPGNKTGVLLLDYILGAKARAGILPENPVALKTIVTTEMAARAAEAHGARSIDTFTGFKFMAERKNHLEADGEGKVIFAYEESYGYMLGDFVRDKDGVTAAILLVEMAAWYFSQGMTLADALEKLYEKLGFYDEVTVNLVMPGTDGLLNMRALMQNLRTAPPSEIAGTDIIVRRDYLDGTEHRDGATTPLELAGSNVLQFGMSDGTSIFVRPSGTEPKIKVYLLTHGDRAACAGALKKYTEWARGLAQE